MAKKGLSHRAYSVRIDPVLLGELPPDYVSLTIDTSLVLGGHWWGESLGLVEGVAADTVSPLELRNPRLREFAALLSPAMLRIGGTEADRVDYRIGKDRKPEGTASEADDLSARDCRELVLKKKLWKRINAFALDAGFRILFVVSAGPEDRDESGSWISSGARALIGATARKKFPVAAWELGNEVNGYPFIHGWRRRVSPSRYIADFAEFSRLVRDVHPGALVAGPASSVWPVIGEPYPLIPALCRSPVMSKEDVVSWHYYPQQSSRGRLANRRASEDKLLNPRRLDSVLRQARRIVKASRGRPVWVTETGHALYGGEPGQSDTHLSSLWWLDQLGLLAGEGISRVFRQSLVGADYGLLDQESFDPRPDYYATFLWKRLMGPRVYAAPEVDGKGRKIRAYLHSREGKRKSLCLLLVNLRGHRSEVSVEARITAKYVVSPLDGLRSARILLNGVPLEEDLLFRWGKKATRKKYLIDAPSAAPETVASEASSSVELPPFSYAFLILKKSGPRPEEAVPPSPAHP